MSDTLPYSGPERDHAPAVGSTGEVPPAGNALTARGLRKSFRSGDVEIHVLKGLDLDVRDGEFLAIEGRSGSGKSTLLHILAGLDAVDGGLLFAGQVEIGKLAAAIARWRRWIARAGQGWIGAILGLLFGWLRWVQDAILVAGTVRADRRLSRIRNREFGFVFQFYHLLPELSVLENALAAPMIEESWLRFRSNEAAHRERANALLTQLGLAHRLRHYPSQLSGGERQRVAIARALMNNPKVLFADEPTGNLDAETGRQIMDVLEGLHRDQGQTIVMVTHDRTLAREADRVLVLKDGRLAPAD